MPALRKKFAKNLVEHRKKRELTQEELAEKLEISVRYVQQLEGKSTPNVKLDTIETLAKVLRTKPSELLK